MRMSIALALSPKSRAMNLSVQGQKTEHFYRIWIKLYCKGFTKKGLLA
jgi:hypothetical protein